MFPSINLESSSSIFFLITTSLLFIFFLTLKTKNPNTKITKLPPGPWKLPIIGNLHQLSGSLPHHRLRDLSKTYGPLMHLKIGQISTIIVSSPEIAQQVMKTYDLTFSSRPYMPAAHVFSYNSTDIAFAPYGEYWRQVKKLCTLELLSAKRVLSFRSIREEEVMSLIKWIGSREGSLINLSKEIYSLANNVVCRASFGSRGSEYQERFLSVLGEAVKLEGGFNVAELFPCMEGFLMWLNGMKREIMRVHKELDGIVGDIIDQHKKGFDEDADDEKKVEDLVDVMLKFQENSDGGFCLSIDNIKAVLGDMIGAGSETSATTIDWAMSELMKHPIVMQKVQAEVREVFNRIGKVNETGISEMKFLKAVVKETLRLHPPIALLVPRECRETCEINGFVIPAKSKVMINAWAIGRDPDYWDEPDSFIPERFLRSYSHIDFKGNDFEFIPFGAGRRICPGIMFGIVNVELPLAMLLYYFDWKHPVGSKCEDLDMTEKFGISVRRKNHLWLVPQRHHP